MKRSRTLPLAVALQMFLAATLASAGTFDITSVSYGGWVRDTYQLVIVNAEARYVGPLDGNDQAWLIQTFLNDSSDEDLEDWQNPDFYGPGKNGTSVTAGMVVKCDGSCPANGSIDKAVCGEGISVQFKGKAGVAIYHQFNPEIDIDYGQVGMVPCIFEEPANENPPDANSNPGCTVPALCTPIVLDLDGNGFRFTGLENAVEFDLDADGMSETLGWTDGAEEEAFLALDRNGNGRIDDGTELFGGASPQPQSSEPEGFKALRVFDEPAQGGTGDGWITAEDAVYPLLRLWLDRNHDGIPQPEELSSLAARGVEGLELRVVDSRRKDRYGNELRWASHLLTEGRRSLRAVDVIFVAR